MAKKRTISTKFWADTFIRELEPLERYLYLYLLTNEHTNICGLYELPLSVMASETSLDPQFVIQTLEKKFPTRVYYVEGWVYLKNFLKNQALNSSSIIEGIERIVKEEIPTTILNQVGRWDTGWGQDGGIVGTPSNLGHYIKYRFKLSTIKYNYTTKDKELAILLYDLIKENNPAWYLKPNWDEWAEDIEKINRLDHRTHEQIEFMIRWCQKNSFWKKNILSPSKLRKQFNQLVVKAKPEIKEGKGREIIGL